VAEHPVRRRKKDRLRAVRKANKAMRDAWEIGSDLRKDVGMRGKLGTGQIDEAARVRRINPDTARKYRGVADRVGDELRVDAGELDATAGLSLLPRRLRSQFVAGTKRLELLAAAVERRMRKIRAEEQ
jgi:hypothetical protein